MSKGEPPDPYQTPTWNGPASAGPETPPSLPPRWRLERRLGSGGQAEVWLAWDGQVSENCAIKIFRPGMDAVARERIRREVWLGRRLQHPRIVRVHELIELPDRFAVAMELVPGGTLSAKLAHGSLSVEETVALADQVLEALEYLHGEEVLHRPPLNPPGNEPPVHRRPGQRREADSSARALDPARLLPAPRGVLALSTRLSPFRVPANGRTCG